MNQSNASHVATDYLWGKLRQLIRIGVKEMEESVQETSPLSNWNIEIVYV